jgi:hypothetical protein
MQLLGASESSVGYHRVISVSESDSPGGGGGLGSTTTVCYDGCRAGLGPGSGDRDRDYDTRLAAEHRSRLSRQLWRVTLHLSAVTAVTGAGPVRRRRAPPTARRQARPGRATSSRFSFVVSQGAAPASYHTSIGARPECVVFRVNSSESGCSRAGRGRFLYLFLEKRSSFETFPSSAEPLPRMAKAAKKTAKAAAKPKAEPKIAKKPAKAASPKKAKPATPKKASPAGLKRSSTLAAAVRSCAAYLIIRTDFQSQYSFI